MRDLDSFLGAATVDPAVYALRPDYRALLVAVDGIDPAAGGVTGEALLRAAEQHAQTLTATTPVEELPHISAWREAFRSFGAKPQRTRNSVEALTRRAVDGLPRVNPLTDLYNAISVLHQIPLGGEDLDRYDGAPRLQRAEGTEPFDTVAGGAEVIEHPEPGEVVWCDGAGVTCRRWNWRQGRRTQLQETSRAALFILDALDPVTDDELGAAGVALTVHLSTLGPQVRTASRLLSPADLDRPVPPPLV